MSKRFLAVAATAAAAVLAVPAAAHAAPAQPLKLRGGLTLYLPIEWEVHRVNPDWTKVVTGKCANPSGEYGTPGCDSFWILGPKAIKAGNELFRPYNGAKPFYPATDVQRCPHNGKWGQVLGEARAKGLRQVGPGHRAAYREWKATCVSYTDGAVKSRYVQREWYLPRTRVLVVDQWNTPGLADALRNADWK
ncbi:hypothetical protein E1286_16285 [Nonomuraea terrae]|uniref:Uncharacterized protein n=1 Tax=Nonomuraea terrae TaxID=2530383 RepID=A0A4R4YS02_9ACTN|nr:hypothetical protein [Nonomuraea terrae]TDD47996.1 hypothetical protein E1286_16285 [Nonomuraea terrae]